MSFEQDIVNTSEFIRKLKESGIKCTDGSFQNGERLIQQKGLNEALKYILMGIKIHRQEIKIKELEEKARELEQRREASTTLPDEDKEK